MVRNLNYYESRYNTLKHRNRENQRILGKLQRKIRKEQAKEAEKASTGPTQADAGVAECGRLAE